LKIGVSRLLRKVGGYCLKAEGLMFTDYTEETWALAKLRWKAWWQHELYDRVLVQVIAPRDAPRAEIPPQGIGPVDPHTQWTDIDFMIRRALEEIRGTYYGGEALPCFWHNWSAGPVILMLLFGHFVLKERLNPLGWTASALGLTGIVCLSLP